LLNSTCEVVAVWSAGGALPQAVLKLAQGGLQVRRTMFLGLVAAVAATVAGVGLAASRIALQAPPPDNPPPKAAPGPVQGPFERLVVGVDPGAFSPEIPCTLTLTPDGRCVYHVVGYPGRGTAAAWPAATRAHTLPPDSTRRLAALLPATGWVTAAPAKEPLQFHQTKYALALRRAGANAEQAFEGEPQPYKDLLAFVRALTLQEFISYRLDEVPEHAVYARRALESDVRAELGDPPGLPPSRLDFARFGGWASRVVRAPDNRPAEDVAAAARLVGLLRLGSEREPLTRLSTHPDPSVRDAARQAVGRLPDPK
jgi:hypothetical protein